MIVLHYLPPHFANGIKTSTRVEVVHAVEAPDDINAVAQHRRAMVRPRTCRIYFLHLETTSSVSNILIILHILKTRIFETGQIR